MRTFIVTTAVNNSPLNKPFWASLKHAAAHRQAKLYVVGAKYRNPTRGRREVGTDDTYPAELAPYLTRKRVALGKRVTLFADVPVQPTARNPAAGFEVLCAGTSAILGHPKRQLQVVPTSSRSPRLIWTTGAVTMPKYSKSRAGAHGREHHVCGALIVEVRANHEYFIRNITANRDGSFTDLDVVYTPDGHHPAHPAQSVVAGDIHVGQEDAPADMALRALLAAVRPKWLVVHDVLDFDARSHHRQSPTERYARRFDTVDAELKANAAYYRAWAPLAENMAVVASNHHEHFDRWLKEFDPTKDVVNAPLYHDTWSEMYRRFNRDGDWPGVYESACRRHGIPDNIRFLTRESSLMIGDVEHALHGDVGPNGTRGCMRAFTRMGTKLTIGHSHTPGAFDNVFQTGVTGRTNMDYTRPPSTQLHAHVVLGHDGKRQIVITLGPRFRG